MIFPNPGSSAGPDAALGATPFQPAETRDTHHLMVSIFDHRTGRWITDAAVGARVAALGLSGVRYSGLFPF